MRARPVASPASPTGGDGRRRTPTLKRQFAAGLALRVSRYPLQAAFLFVVPPVLGPEAYGAYATCLALSSIVAESTDLGTLPLFGRFAPGLGPEGVKTLARQVLFSRLALTLVGGTVLLWLLWTPRPEDPLLFGLVLAVVAVVPIQQVLFARLYARGEIARVMARDPVRSGMSLVLVVPGYLLAGLVGAVGAILVAQTVLAVLAAAWVRPAARDFAPPAGWVGFGASVRFGLAAALPSMLVSVTLKLGTPLLSRLGRSPAEVASFDLAAQALAILASLAQYPHTALLPSLAAEADAGRAREARQVLGQVLQRVAAAAAVGVVALVAIGERLLTAVLGPGFASVYGNLVLLVGGGVLPLLVNQAGLALGVLEKRPGRAALPAALLAVVTAAGTLATGARFGAPAACLALVAGVVVQSGALLVATPGLASLAWRPVGLASLSLLPAFALGLLEQAGLVSLAPGVRAAVVGVLLATALVPLLRLLRRPA